MKNVKTNAIRILEQKKAVFRVHRYEPDGIPRTGVEVAELLGQEPAAVYKTLVTCGKSGANYVFVIPVAAELNLKKAAEAVGEKSIAMLKSKDLLGLTGYIHGGCSPVGMKKLFPTLIDRSAEARPAILLSGGRIGMHIEISLAELRKALPFQLAGLV
ncbi:MAG: Cys-tRNA(Pro) deacylase [Oscillospiraceae bacterium]|nr:Cys-tRNA(Pro) deacylase [Oscillospiraceae bacterium]